MSGVKRRHSNDDKRNVEIFKSRKIEPSLARASHSFSNEHWNFKQLLSCSINIFKEFFKPSQLSICQTLLEKLDDSTVALFLWACFDSRDFKKLISEDSRYVRIKNKMLSLGIFFRLN